MQQLFQLFYRKVGVRRVQNLVTPSVYEFLDFPRNVILHYLTHDDEHMNVDTSKLYFKQFNKKINIDYKDVGVNAKGNPRLKSVVIKNLFRPFHIEHKQFRYLKDAATLTNDQTALVIINYNYLYSLYKYPTLPLAKYYEWWNVEKTRWDNIEALSSKSDRNHFVFIEPPSLIPAFSLLRMYSKMSNLAMLKIFDDISKLFLLEMFKWIDPETRESSVLSSIKIEHLNKVDIVFTSKNGQSSVLNLGYLNSWIKGSENVTEFSNVSQYDPIQIQKLFLKYMMTLSSLIPEETIDVSSAVSSTEVPKQTDDVYEQGMDDDGDHSENLTTYAAEPLKKSNDQLASFAEDDGKDHNKSVDNILTDIDDDIDALEKINKVNLKTKGVHIGEDGELQELPDEYKEEISEEEVKNKVYGYKDSTAALTDQISEYAEYGLLSASEYKKLVKDVDTYKNMQDPYGTKELVTSKMIVTADDIKIDATKSEIIATDLIVDKSMLQSSLQSFDEDYVGKVMQKDNLAMCNALQKAGIIIRRHEVEVDNSALGAFEHHVMEFKPLDGAVSTLHFKIPKVNTDGTFMANGSKYVMRKQRIDLPIRKIGPSEVALTSYYGKTFVSLSSKKANSSIEWIIKKLNKAAFDEQSNIKNVAPANVFDNNFPAPYIYNALANHFKTFKVGNYNFNFDYTDRQHLVGKLDLKVIEEHGKIVAGQTYEGNPIVIDKEDQFYIYTKNTYVPIGDIYKILGVEALEAPVDFSELRVFSKSVPTGIVLAYFIGFKALLVLLKATYRVVVGRKNKNLEDHEYSITFLENSYIFTRKERLNSLILSGFIEYDKQIKQYHDTEFESKDVYLNLLSSKGLSAIYIREMDLSDQLFVDPITKSILEEMNEPVTLRGLIIRASEMLLTYHHPDSQDMSCMRVRGYERFSGVIYKEMVTSIRQYRSKNIAGKSKIDMSPYQVWTAIMKDPAIKLIEDINPIQNLKESEIITYVGDGGRSKEGMNKASRAYHVNDFGIVSEATVDSTDVGINAYLSANPNFSNLRGVPSKNKKVDPTNIVSTSALLSPGASHDD